MNEKLRVLVVDDNRDALFILGRIASDLGCEVRKCQESPKAIELVKEFAPNIVFLDIGMPELDGFEVAEDLQDLDLPNHMLVAVTCYNDEPHRAEAKRCGFDLFIEKPITPEQVRSVVESAKQKFSAAT